VDFVWLGIAALFFVVCRALVRLCERLMS